MNVPTAKVRIEVELIREANEPTDTAQRGGQSIRPMNGSVVEVGAER
jgi:hypothetical protein